MCIFALSIIVYNNNKKKRRRRKKKKNKLLKFWIIEFLLHSSLPQFSDLWHLVLFLSRDKLRTVFVAPKNKFAVYMYFTIFLRQLFTLKVETPFQMLGMSCVLYYKYK